MKKIILLILLLAPALCSLATHNRAGEITYRQISQFTYQITMITYTYTSSEADRDSLEISWGDGSYSWALRTIKTGLPDQFNRNVYIANHTFPGAGNYEISMLDQNRNAGIGNIDGSVNIPFAIKTRLLLNPQIGFNNTPILLTQPLDKAAVGKLYVHNPAAYDIDGDSLSYKLTTCLGDNGEPIPTYRFPASSNRPIFINETTGDLIWDSPTTPGNYNVAFYIEEWRSGIKIGQVLRDMQITVVESENIPPKLNEFNELCVEAGQKIALDIIATDANKDFVKLNAYGGPFEQKTSPATFSQIENTAGRSTGKFTWNTTCEHVSKSKYQVEFKAEDENWDVRLVDFSDLFITVVAPAPEITQLIPTNNTITLEWTTQECTGSNLLGFKIYRKIDVSNYTPKNCVTGMPDGLGFELIADLSDPNQRIYLDNNKGVGLRQGQIYCYRIVGVFSNGAESYPSLEKCERVIRGVPVITNVDVKSTSSTTGEIDVAWVKPTEHDVTRYPGPYHYVIYRAEGIWGNNYSRLAQLDGIDNTDFVDSNINTADTAYNYKVEFYSNDELVSPPQTASSTFIRPKPRNNMFVEISHNVPWINTSYTVFRKAGGEIDFTEVGTTETNSYADTDVEVNKEYCYRVKAHGYFSVKDIKEPIVNNSQEACADYIDNTPPCPPSLIVDSNCDDTYNILTWTNTDELCNSDIAGYQIYYSANTADAPTLIETIEDPIQLSWTHYTNGTMAGCYQVLAYDYFDNKSQLSTKACIDKCSQYELPNAFSPDNNKTNDVYHPIEPYYGVDRVEFKVFNRWGKLVFETTDPQINWDGKDQQTGKVVANGTYFYTCTVYEARLTGIEDRHISGFIQVIAHMQSIQKF